MQESESVALIRHSVAVIAVIAAGAAAYALSDILTPLALAVFLSILIDGFVRVLSDRARLPPRVALPAALLLSVLLFGGALYVIADRGAGFVSELLGYGPKLNAVIAEAAGIFHIAVPPTLGQLFQQLDPVKFIAPAAAGLKGFAANALFVLVYMGFLFASRHGFRRKLVSLFPNHAARENAVHAFERIRNGVEQYLYVQTVTGLIIAASAWVVMSLIHLDNALFWAFLMFVVCYIPVIGGAVAILFPPVFALVQFPTYGPAVILICALGTIHFVVGNIILPRMQGESLNMDPVVLLLSLAFWTAIWGLPGAFLSTPLTVTAMIILAQFPSSRWIAVLLSGNGDPESAGRSKVGYNPGEPPLEPKAAPDRPRKRRSITKA
jgi:predicted PurR-regulated permease PerM